MIIKPLLIEHLVAELTLDPRVGGMMLALVVGQGCIHDTCSYEKAARVVTMQDILCIKESLLTTSLHFILATLLLTSACLLRRATVFDGDTPGDTLLSLDPASIDASDPQLHTCHQQGSTRGAAWVDNCQASSLGDRESKDGTECGWMKSFVAGPSYEWWCGAFFFLIEIPKVTLRKRIKKDSSWQM